MSYSPVGRLRCFTSTLYRGSVNGKSRVVLMKRFPTHATMNTYATSARFCAYADRSCNRLCIPEARPDVLRTGTDSVIIPEHSPRSPEKAGDTTIHCQSTEKIQVVQDSIFKGGVSGDTVERRLTFCQSRDTDDNEGSQELNQSSVTEGTNNKGQSKSVHQSHFELEAADNKSHPLETTLAKVNLDKIQIQLKTRNLSYC
jgi:hypothetical protein